jgi:hypothetical protein
VSGNNKVTRASQYEKLHLFKEVNLMSEHTYAVPQNYIRMYLTFHTGCSLDKALASRPQTPKWFGRTLVALTSQTLVLFQPSQLSLISTMDRAVARVNALTRMWVSPVTQLKKRGCLSCWR